MGLGPPPCPCAACPCPVGLLGTHFLALPPFVQGGAALAAGDEPRLDLVIQDVPAASEWGVIAMVLLVLAAGTVVLRRRVRSATA
ncbi:MAG: IPTL-CTERM sorting domain-containing protein [Phycisphaerae bacterium]